MGVRIASSANTTIVNGSIANSTEAVVGLCGPIGLIYDNAQVLIHWMIQCSVGAAATNLTAKIRRGSSIAGTQLNVTVNDNVVASTAVLLSGTYVDTPGVAAGLQYVVTLVVIGGAAAVNVSDVCIAAIVL